MSCDPDPALAATACNVPFLLDPALALGRHNPYVQEHEVFESHSSVPVGVWCAVCCVHLPAPVSLERSALVIASLRLSGPSS